MDSIKFTSIIRKYKKCPQCDAEYKTTKIQVQLKEEIVEISCECGFLKYVDENNKEIEPNHLLTYDL